MSISWCGWRFFDQGRTRLECLYRDLTSLLREREAELGTEGDCRPPRP